MMKARLCFCLLFIFPIFINISTVQAQEISDSALLEQALDSKNEGLADSLVNSWSVQSINQHHEKLENDTDKFVYQIYSRFMKDYLHKKMAGKNNTIPNIPVNRKYFFVQNELKYLFIDSLSFEDLHYYFGTIFHHYGFLLYKDSIGSYFAKTIDNSKKNGSLKTIAPFYPDLNKIFYDSAHDPKPIYIKENNHINILLHFLGYESLTPVLTSYLREVDTTQLDRREDFLSHVFEFSQEKNKGSFLRSFRYPFQPEVLYILVDAQMRYALVEYLTAGYSVNMAFYPLKLLQSEKGERSIPLSWGLFVY